MTVTTKLVVSPQTPTTPLVPGQPLPYEWLKWFQNTAQAINAALTILGQFNGVLGTDATVEGHPGTLASVVQNLTASGQLAAAHLTGVVNAAQLPAALPATQGAVQLPPGAPSNTLGTAALSNATAFDPAGAAATAQTNAEAFATTAANAAQVNAQNFARNASNLSGGTVDTALLAGLSVIITTAQLTPTGAQGSMTLTNGLLTAQTPAT